MEHMEHNKPFEQLVIPRKDLRSVITRYRVYSSASEFVSVEARTALEAIEVSGIKGAYKIIKDDPMGNNLLSSKDWNEMASGIVESEGNVVAAGDMMSAGSSETGQEVSDS